ncbi:Putative P4-family integrase [Pseudooceanicola batsensis HTCC2597]|uniref:Putative P4-family integrase n=1 Tax=Pseudooceanicola batsensis (strain ATCC BAA-863 / DSM 15984 / KCTC 12145 / HTCC2597) TaxID=252305 RepID=A3TXF6_PSEBH|nr:tyrosine-type recombinase/integrase [Pseudooceanicola batsensis]EAQ03516.1 Putative P4-family integrase [Pseudooceanicola batsensis HTCC2597]
MESYVFPKIGAVQVAKIETADVISTLTPIWAEKPETANRVRQRVEAVIDYASALGNRTGDNPARWRGHLDHLLPKPKKVRAVVHHPALPHAQIADFMTALAEREGVAARALAFTILTAARSGETRGMTWGEVDLHAEVWTIPAGRMKAAKEHRVPLTDAALALLGKRAETAPDDALIFGSETKPGKPIRHERDRGLAPHGAQRHHRPWIPLNFPRLGGGNHRLPPRSHRSGAGARHQG